MSSPPSPSSPAFPSFLRSFDCYCFDVDSTAIVSEGIDVLAESMGKAEEVKQYTMKAMNGDIPFEVALAARLDLLRPSLSSLSRCLAAHSSALAFTSGFLEFIEMLKQMNKQIFLVSGGFRQMIAPVQSALGLSDSHVFANRLLFAADGAYAGFDHEEPTARSGGKAKALATILARHSSPSSPKRLVMIGDGATDLEARPPADYFIGYGGVTVREKVKEGADWFITDWKQIISIMQEKDVEASN